ncbi:uncharacterized protein LOC123298299 [Chrysoperla carnea]|uniref:uncharacterized protein LOC123298299 n=1 Tax=Chrysoperla carnea TaxID=189513 RepID=UPI001D06A412|nr:uncharacterized protein LOC123298299 [Chrysoperla carnea]
MEDQFKDDILRPIENDKVLELRDLYLIDWPKYCSAYYHIEMAHTWMTKYNANTKFYSVEGNFDDATLIFITREPGWNATIVYYYTLDETNARLYKGLSKTKRINWNEEICTLKHYRHQLSVAFDLAKELKLHFHYLDTTALWWLPKEKALEFEIKIPDNTFISPLSVEHAKKIHGVWPFKAHRPIEYIENMIKYNNGVGIFDQNDKTLMAWILLNDYGSLAILQTDENYKRRGYAKIVTKALCKKFAENNMDSLSFITLGNTPSETLFEGLGFKIVDYLCWVGMKPSKNKL